MFVADWVEEPAGADRGFDAGVEPYTLIGIGFLMVSLPSAWLVRRLERRISYERIS